MMKWLLMPMVLAIVPTVAVADKGDHLHAPVTGVSLANSVPQRSERLSAAIFVQNHAGEALDASVPMFRDLLTARLTEKGFAIMDGHDVAERFRETEGSPDPVVDVLRAVDQIGLHASLFGDFAQAVGIGAVGRANHQNKLNLPRHSDHRVLAVLRRIANVAQVRANDARIAVLQRRDNARGVRCAERCLRHIRERRRGWNIKRSNISLVAHDAQPVRHLPAHALHFRVARMADEDDLKAALDIANRLVVHALHERTNRVDHVEPARLRIALHGTRYAMCAEHDERAVGHLG